GGSPHLRHCLTRKSRPEFSCTACSGCRALHCSGRYCQPPACLLSARTFRRCECRQLLPASFCRFHCSCNCSKCFETTPSLHASPAFRRELQISCRRGPFSGSGVSV